MNVTVSTVSGLCIASIVQKNINLEDKFYYHRIQFVTGHVTFTSLLQY